MLSARYLSRLPNDLVYLFSEFEISVIEDMAMRISKANYETDTYKWQEEKLNQLGYMQNEIDKAVNKVLNRAYNTSKEIIEESCTYSVKDDNKTYLKAYDKGLTLTYPLDLKDTPHLVQLLDAGISQTNWEIKNFTRTTANVATKQFIELLDLSWLQVSSGAMTTRQATKEAVQKLGREGLKVVDYASGRQDQVDVAVKRAIIGGVNKTSGKINEQRINDMGVKLVRTSSHLGARPDHALWQGKVFYWNEPVEGYESFIENTAYGEGRGIKGWNCKHDFSAFFPGISTLTDPKYDSEENIKIYEAEQKLREIERTIRKWKREKAAIDAGNQDSSMQNAKIREWQKKAREHVKENKLTRQNWREQI